MRISAILLACGVIALSATAGEARTRHHSYSHAPAAPAAPGWGWGAGAPQVAYREQTHGRATMARSARSYGYGNLSGPCQIAARMGGPCGCIAESLLLGRTEHVLNGVNMWLASAWLAFAHVPAGPGTAAVMRGHVVAVVADNGNGTVRVHDSWAIHDVSKRRIIAFVDPHQLHCRKPLRNICSADILSVPWKQIFIPLTTLARSHLS